MAVQYTISLPNSSLTLQWCHNERDGVSNHQHHDCLPTQSFIQAQIRETSNLCFTGLCAGNSLVTGEFPAQRPVSRKMFPFEDVIMNPSLVKSHLPITYYSVIQSFWNIIQILLCSVQYFKMIGQPKHVMDEVSWHLSLMNLRWICYFAQTPQVQSLNESERGYKDSYSSRGCWAIWAIKLKDKMSIVDHWQSNIVIVI